MKEEEGEMRGWRVKEEGKRKRVKGVVREYAGATVRAGREATR